MFTCPFIYFCNPIPAQYLLCDPKRTVYRQGLFSLVMHGIKDVIPEVGGGGDTPYDGLYGEAPSERGIFFTIQVCERVGISLVEV